MRLSAFVVSVVVLAACAKPTVTHDEALNFETVKLGLSRTLPFVVTNPGAEAVEVVFISSDRQFTLATNRLVVPAKGTASLDVTFRPTRLAAETAELTVLRPEVHRLVDVQQRADAAPAQGRGAAAAGPQHGQLGRLGSQAGGPEGHVE
ncbi:MAG: hypothetical protein ACO1OB_00625 [Archangium sp.]